MAPNRGRSSQPAALCATIAFVWLSYSFERHSLLEKTRLSAFLVFGISAFVSFGASFFSEWLPGANGRFDEGAVVFAESQPNLPKRPRRFFLPLLIACIVVRLEIFSRISYDLQCSKPGLEAFLPLMIQCYELLPGRRDRRDVDKEEDEFMRTMADDIGDWIQNSATPLVISILTFIIGVYLVSNSTAKSTYFCSHFDYTSMVVVLQWLGLFLDAAIIIILWRILSWARTTKSRLRTLSTILFLTAAVLGLALAAMSLSQSSGTPWNQRLPRGLDSLYAFDVTIDGFTISALIISTSLYICESAPSALFSPVAFICGLLAVWHRLADLGNFTQISRFDVMLPLYLLAIGFSVFLYAHRLRSVIFIPRALLVFCLLAMVIGTTIYALLVKQTLNDHPLRNTIYDTRIEQDRWLTQATVSKSRRVAVQEYKERHHGRSPPPQFDVWYQFAVDRNSVIIDHFDQIQRDLLPFWGLKPADIREDLKRIAAEPDIAVITVLEGTASHSQRSEDSHKPLLDELVDMINVFASYLPNMELPVNLAQQPRILVPWDELHGLMETGTHVKSKHDESLKGVKLGSQDGLGRPSTISARQFRHMNAITCPPGSTTRSGVHWNVRDFCSACTLAHSKGQYLKDWQLSTNICHQPDILRLHGFYMSPPTHTPLQDLMPVFSASKAEGFNDILIPLPRSGADQTRDTGASFEMKDAHLFWRGKIEQQSLSHDVIRGGHQERLAHLANNASSFEQTTVMLPMASRKSKWAYEQASTRELNAALFLNLGISDYSACTGPDCDKARAEFGLKAEDLALTYRHVLLPDTDSGPSPAILPTLRSTSVPFISSIFKEWYSERLMPWLHFVPVDVRYHALHSTLAYFTGMKGHGQVNGRDPGMDGAVDDARWIAEQGRKWAEKAVRKEDAQVYLFRLLLEWGRIIDDRREELGFKLE